MSLNYIIRRMLPLIKGHFCSFKGVNCFIAALIPYSNFYILICQFCVYTNRMLHFIQSNFILTFYLVSSHPTALSCNDFNTVVGNSWSFVGNCYCSCRTATLAFNGSLRRNIIFICYQISLEKPGLVSLCIFYLQFKHIPTLHGVCFVKYYIRQLIRIIDITFIVMTVVNSGRVIYHLVIRVIYFQLPSVNDMIWLFCLLTRKRFIMDIQFNSIRIGFQMLQMQSQYLLILVLRFANEKIRNRNILFLYDIHLFKRFLLFISVGNKFSHLSNRILPGCIKPIILT